MKFHPMEFHIDAFLLFVILAVLAFAPNSVICLLVSGCFLCKIDVLAPVSAKNGIIFPSMVHSSLIGFALCF